MLLNKYINHSFSSSPSKFGKGVGLLWRGNDLYTVNKLIGKVIKSIIFKNSISLPQTQLLFESARTALYHCLCANNISRGADVIISSFTCDAVTYAVKSTGANVIYVDINDDLTMNDDHVMDAITVNTKAVVCQNTFGRLGLKVSTIEKLMAQGIFVIEDCALSIGSKLGGNPLGTFGDVSLWSLEVSKTVTIGWGGVLTINNPLYAAKIRQRYNLIKSVPLFLDLRRILQLWCSMLLTRIKIPGAVFFWYFMYGTRIFRKSNSFTKAPGSGYEKIGKISNLLFASLSLDLDNIFIKTKSNYEALAQTANRFGLSCPIIEQNNEFIVSPRFSLLVKNKNLSAILKEGKRIGVEVGRWFTDAPPVWSLSDCKIYSSDNAKKISNRIINFPCHWTLNDQELAKVIDFMKFIAADNSH